MKALIIEDSRDEQAFLRHGLNTLGYSCETAANGRDGLRRLLNHHYDLVLVDMMLPGLDGKEIIRQARLAGITTHIIIISALGAISERVAGLNVGADDYMPKPCSLDELKARIEAFNRRFAGNPSRLLKLHDIELDVVSHTCRRKHRIIELSKIEFAILECLMRHHGSLVTKNLLFEEAWGFDVDSTTDVIPPHISRIRSKLVDVGESDPIENKRGEGYVFN